MRSKGQDRVQRLKKTRNARAHTIPFTRKRLLYPPGEAPGEGKGRASLYLLGAVFECLNLLPHLLEAPHRFRALQLLASEPGLAKKIKQTNKKGGTAKVGQTSWLAELSLSHHLSISLSLST